jgi:hypothetical protein
VVQPIAAARLDELQEKIGALLDKFKKLPSWEKRQYATPILRSLAIKDAAANLDKFTGTDGSLNKV